MNPGTFKKIALATTVVFCNGMAYAIHGVPLENFDAYQMGKLTTEATLAGKVELNPVAAPGVQPILLAPRLIVPEDDAHFAPKRHVKSVNHR